MGRGGTCPAPGGLSKKLHAKAAAEKARSITLVNQSFDERKTVVLRSDASDKTAKQNESDDHFRLADSPPGISVSLQVEHKQFIGNGQLIGSSLR